MESKKKGKKSGRGELEGVEKGSSDRETETETDRERPSPWSWSTVDNATGQNLVSTCFQQNHV